MQFFTVILSALALAVSTTTATPLDARATFSLNITAPKEGDKWVAGTKQLVEWDTSNIPKSDKHDLCYIVLGHYDGKSKYEYKDMKHPLTGEFDLTAGSQNVTVPHVPNGNQYFIDLMVIGGSTYGNQSANFTITNN